MVNNKKGSGSKLPFQAAKDVPNRDRTSGNIRNGALTSKSQVFNLMNGLNDLVDKNLTGRMEFLRVCNKGF